ncbi:MAG TPA: polysaccharide ABC transporter ATP-binding protein [Candidatus Udaeobacter sp.]|jgi:lipopolysaccharide transport system ATP-binding protein|nr:polysaccharide ABC transporter ATP-binding protein [Candidatus Udaeobacter sp.]
MSSNSAIIVEGLGKSYIIGHRSAQGDGMRHALETALRSPLRYLKSVRSKKREAVEEFWALRNISLEIKQGEVVGIIGRNGAGKSTLLKILSRITDPTKGRVRMRGRVSSLLEVGTGFHAELTGRENIFLNGAILGMARAEIIRKFDEIVAFSGVEKFLDTPVKRYSSGMYVRLAFAVAAHLEPEILIVDEVLAVGDSEFQKKCLEKMDDVGQSGRTVLFVSHNMQAITRLCSRCVLIERGDLRMDDTPLRTTQAYLKSASHLGAVREWHDLKKAPGDDVVRLCAVRAISESGEPAEAFDIRSSVGIELEYQVLKPGYFFLPHFLATNESGVEMFVANDMDPEWRGRRRPPGRYVSTGWIPGNLLVEGIVTIGTALMTLDPEIVHGIELNAIEFRVVFPAGATDTARGDFRNVSPGVVQPMLKWTTRYEPSPLSAAAVESEVGVLS